MVDDNNNNGSLLRSAIGFAPLGVGIGIAARRMQQDGAHVPVKKSLLTSALESLHEPSGTPRIPDPDEVRGFMRTGISGQMLQGDTVKQAWEWAMLGVDPSTRESLLAYTKNIANMSNIEAIQAIELTMRENKSTLMRNIWQRFRTNVGLLEQQRGLLGTIPQYSPISTGQVTTAFPGSVPRGIEQSISRIASNLGVQVPRIRGITRPELAGEGFGVFSTTFRTGFGDIGLSIPATQSGLLYEGATLQTKRIAPDVLILGPEGPMRMSRSEYFLREIEESVVPDIGTRLKSQREITKAIKQVRERVFGELETVPAIPSYLRTSAQEQYEKLRGAAIDIRVQETSRKLGPASSEFESIFRKPTDRELSELMTSETGRKMGLTGGVGPSAISKGRLSTVPWEQFDITGGPVEYGRRPEQPFRRFQLTNQATEFLNKHRRLSKYRAYETAGQVLSQTNAMGPSMKAVYVSPESAALATGGRAELLERLGMGEGEALIRAGVAKNLAFESVETVKLATVRPDLLKAGFQGITAGEIIGTTIEGRPFQLTEQMRVLGSQAFEAPGAGEYLSLAYAETHPFAHGTKLFGGAKAVTQVRKEREFQKAIQEITGRTQDADIIVNMDELRKNKALHRRQMLTALSDTVAETMRSQPNKRAMRQLWQRDISRLGRGFVAGATRGDIYSHEKFIENMMRFATETVGVHPEQFGEIFGAVPTVLGQEPAAEMLQRVLSRSNLPVEQFRQTMFRGFASGAAAFSFGGPAIEVGGLGSLEPRAFEILGGPAWKGIGPSLSEEFMGRLAITQPEKMRTHQQLGYTLESFVGQLKGPQPGTVFEAAQGYNASRMQALMEQGSFMIRPGKGQRDIYVPSAKVLSEEALSGLRQFETAGGTKVRTELGSIYHDIAAKASQFATGDIKVEQYQKDVEVLANRIRQQWAPFGKGAGSLARGKVAGSTFLRGMTASALGEESVIREANVVGVSREAFETMTRQMIDSGFEEAGIQEMAQRFRTGGRVGGVISRHPFIGEFSLQPILFQEAKGAGPTDILIPEVGVNVRAEVAARGLATEKRITLGPLVGMAGDKDADLYSALLVSPDNEKLIRRSMMTTDNEFAQRYVQHQIRMQLFKPKAASDIGLTTIEKMVGDVEKLGAGQRWIAPLSIQLSTAKEALATRGKGAGAADARFLLEWLEQTPISAKHMSAQEAAGGGLSSMMETITSALETRNEVRLNEAIKGIVANDAMSSAMLTGNVTLTEGAEEISRIMDVNIGRNIAGIDINTASHELMRTLSDHHANGGIRAYERLAGRGSRIKFTEIPEMIAKGAVKGMGLAEGSWAKVSAAMSASSNTLGQIGRGIIKHHKAIGLGFAGSIALSSVLSSPRETLGPGSAMIPNAKMMMSPGKAANRMSPETVAPPQQSIGRPTPPSRLIQQQARIAPGGTPSRRINIRARAESFVNTDGIAGQVAGLGMNTSVQLKDNRSSLLPHEIANKVL